MTRRSAVGLGIATLAGAAAFGLAGCGERVGRSSDWDASALPLSAEMTEGKLEGQLRRLPDVRRGEGLNAVLSSRTELLVSFGIEEVARTSSLHAFDDAFFADHDLICFCSENANAMDVVGVFCAGGRAIACLLECIEDEREMRYANTDAAAAADLSVGAAPSSEDEFACRQYAFSAPKRKGGYGEVAVEVAAGFVSPRTDDEAVFRLLDCNGRPEANRPCSLVRIEPDGSRTDMPVDEATDEEGRVRVRGLAAERSYEIRIADDDDAPALPVRTLPSGIWSHSASLAASLGERMAHAPFGPVEIGRLAVEKAAFDTEGGRVDPPRAVVRGYELLSVIEPALGLAEDGAAMCEARREARERGYFTKGGLVFLGMPCDVSDVRISFVECDGCELGVHLRPRTACEEDPAGNCSALIFEVPPSVAPGLAVSVAAGFPGLGE